MLVAVNTRNIWNIYSAKSSITNSISQEIFINFTIRSQDDEMVKFVVEVDYDGRNCCFKCSYVNLVQSYRNHYHKQT